MNMSKARLARFSLPIFLLIMGLIFSLWPYVTLGKEDTGKEERPARLLVMGAEYPGVVVPLGEKVNMDLIFNNKGRADESVKVWIASIPKGWKAKIKTYQYTVTGVYVPAGKDKALTFEAEPEKEVRPGKYEFLLKAETPDGQFKIDQNITVTVKEKEEGIKEIKGVRLTTSYPVLRGPSDAKFEFSLEAENKLEKDTVFNLFAQGPEGWEVNFKPAYESKYISSLRLKANENQTVAVEVKPSLQAKAGEYPINIRVTSGAARGEAKLVVVLTGTYNLEAGTLSGLLSVEARQGKPANLSIYVKNTGSATNHDIKFLSFKPENWKVEFKPEKIPTLEPGGLKQVEVTITPYEQALVGDYSVGVNIDGEKASKTVEFRITVKASTAWGWIGIGIIFLVILGLVGLFRRLGRR